MMEIRDMFEQLDDARSRAGIAWGRMFEFGAEDWTDFVGRG
jgi:hypothetical protein